MSSTVCVCVSVWVLRCLHALRPMCGSGKRRGVVTSPFCASVQLVILLASGDGGSAFEVAAMENFQYVHS